MFVVDAMVPRCRCTLDFVSLKSWLRENKPTAYAKVAGRPCALAVQCVLYRECSHILYCVRVFKFECSHWRRFVQLQAFCLTGSMFCTVVLRSFVTGETNTNILATVVYIFNEDRL